MMSSDFTSRLVDNNVATVEESAPSAGAISHGVTALWFQNTFQAQPDWPGLKKLIIRAAPFVTEVRITSSSVINQYDFLSQLDRLMTLRIETRDLGDLSVLPKLLSLEELVILSRQRTASSLDCIKSLPLRFLSLERPALRELATIAENSHLERLLLADSKFGNLDNVFLPRGGGRGLDLIILNADASKYFMNSSNVGQLSFRICKRLEMVFDDSAQRVTFDTCKKINLSSIELPRATELQLLNFGEIHGFDFCKKCPNLEHYVFSKGKILGSLLELKAFKIKTLFVSGVPRVPVEDLVDLSSGVENCIVTNGDICFRGGRCVPVAEYYDAVPKL